MNWTAPTLALLSACGSVEVAADAGPEDAAAHVADAPRGDGHLAVDAAPRDGAQVIIDAQTVFTPHAAFVQASPFTVYDQSGDINFQINYAGGMPNDNVSWSASLSSPIGSLIGAGGEVALDGNGSTTFTLIYQTQSSSNNGQFVTLNFTTNESSNDAVANAMLELETACPAATSFTLMGEIMCPVSS